MSARIATACRLGTLQWVRQQLAAVGMEAARQRPPLQMTHVQSPLPGN